MKNFITENDITFTEGNRNATITTLIGYSQHLGITKQVMKDNLSSEIAKDSFINDEIDRLWNYCENRNYKKFWNSEEAKLRYKF